MKFIKTCAAVFALSGMACVYGMESKSGDSGTNTESKTDGQPQTRGSYTTTEAKASVTGQVRAVLHVDVEGFDSKDLELYREGGEITQADKRTLTFKVENIGTNYNISFSGDDCFANEQLKVDGETYCWTMRGKEHGGKIGVNMKFYPATTENSGERLIRNSNPMRAGDDWIKGEYKLIVIPQPLRSDTIIDSYKGSIKLKIEESGS